MRRKTKTITRKTYPQLHSYTVTQESKTAAKAFSADFDGICNGKSHRYNKARFGSNFYELLWRHLWFAQKYLDMLIDFYTVDVHNKIMIQSFKNCVAGFNSSSL